jgi:hypothetical protein
VEYPSQVDAAYLTCEAMICYGCALPAYPRATLEYPKSTPERALAAYPRATLEYPKSTPERALAAYPRATLEYPKSTLECALAVYLWATLEYPKSTLECALSAYPWANLNAAIVNASEHRRGYPRRATRCNHDMAYIRKWERLKWD